MVNRSTTLYPISRSLRPQRKVHLETMKYIFIYLLLTLKIFGQEYSIQVLGFHICDVNQNITNSKRIDFSTQNRGLFDFFWPAKNNYSTEFDPQDYSIKKWNKTVNQGSYKKHLSAFLDPDKTMIYSNDQKIGVVTSGNHSPKLSKGIGLGYINLGYHKIGAIISIEIRNKLVNAQIVKTPFINQTSLFD